MNSKPLVAVLFMLSVVACAPRTLTTTDESSVSTSTPGATGLMVTVLGLKSDEGEVVLALFDSAESFKNRTDAVATGKVPAGDGMAVWQVENLPPGTYALAVYHDLNGNGELDRTTLGPPDEPYGFSNDARGTFGPPKFDKAALEIGPANRVIEVNVR